MATTERHSIRMTFAILILAFWTWTTSAGVMCTGKGEKCVGFKYGTIWYENTQCATSSKGKWCATKIYTDGKKKDLNKTYGYGCAPCKAKETCENKHDKFRYCHARQHCGRSRGDCEKTCCMENGKEKCAYGPSGKGRVKCVDYRKGYYWYNPTQCIGNSLKGFWCATRTRWGTLIEKGLDCKDCE